MDRNKIDELLEKEGFIRWLFTADPQSPWSSWYTQSTDNKQVADKFRVELKRLPLRTSIAQEDSKVRLKERILDSIANASAPKPKVRALRAIRWTAAAILVGAVAISSLTLNGRRLIVSSNGRQQAVVLPDGSKVRLNAGSSLAYNSFWWRISPSVKLEGEGYFYGDHQKGFDVGTSAGNVTVLGTQFNVYCRNSTYRIECYQGKVLVKVNLPSNPEVLQGGQRLSADIKNKTIQRELLDAPNVKPCWTLGEFYYDKARFDEVLSELERQFSITIVGKEQFRHLSYTGYFSTRDVSTALQMTLSPMNIGYQKHNKQVTLTARK
jgi:transmembrane sensor